MLRQMFIKATVALLFLSIASGQQPSTFYSLRQAATLVTSALKITVQQPSSGARRVHFKSATIYCAAACAASVIANSTAATATAATLIQHNSAVRAPVTLGYTSSNASGGTTVYTHNLAAGETRTVDLSTFEMSESLTSRNLSISLASMSGAVDLIITFEEIPQ